MFTRVKLGLALGAGGARGLSHIGVLKALERAGVKIHYLAGSSIGALVGAGYAVSGNAAQLEQRTLEFLKSDLYKESGLALIKNVFTDKPDTLSRNIQTWIKRAYIQAKFAIRPAILDSDLFRRIIEFFIPDTRIEDLSLPFRALGTDLYTGRAVLFKSGSLRDAVYASAAMPGVVHPLESGDLLVVDGGVLNMAPVLPVRHMGADVVLAVDIEKSIESRGDFGSALEHLFRVEDIQNHYLRQIHLQNAEMVIKPEVGHIHWSDFERAREAIHLGQDEVHRRIERIRRLTYTRRFPWRRRWYPPPARDWIEV